MKYCNSIQICKMVVDGCNFNQITKCNCLQVSNIHYTVHCNSYSLFESNPEPSFIPRSTVLALSYCPMLNKFRKIRFLLSKQTYQILLGSFWWLSFNFQRHFAFCKDKNYFNTEPRIFFCLSYHKVQNGFP